MRKADRLISVVRDTLVSVLIRDDRNLSARQLAVFLVCYLEDGPNSVRDLSARLGVQKPAISRALDRLEHLDLVRRRKDPSDRRNIMVGRTAAGRILLREMSGMGGAASSQIGDSRLRAG